MKKQTKPTTIFITLVVLLIVVNGCSMGKRFIEGLWEDSEVKQLNSVVAVVHRLYDLEEKARGLSDRTRLQLTKADSKLEMSLLNEAENTFRDAALGYKNLKLPNGLSKEKSKKLQHIIDNYQTGYEAKAEEIYYAKKFFVDLNPSNIQLSVTNQAQAEVHLNISAKSIKDLGQSLGVDLLKNKKKYSI
ncbi:hypothetical protein PV433_18380 [Paenibacillus sp. GYB004]|uniref:hypothetical protein n=1 Tax=Paenibacillus sp. GYB004 TaxID=2994393 RepID=UPI002F96E186